MKTKLLITLLTLLSNFTIKLHAQYVEAEIPKSRNQYISYTVPINTTTETDNFGKIIGFKNDFSSEELEELSFVRLSKDERREFVETVFEKVKSGQVTAYSNGLGDGISIIPELKFNYPIETKGINRHLGKEITLNKRYSSDDPDVTTGLAFSGDIMTDEMGVPITFDTIIPYTIDDISSITFLENWIINTTTNVLEKQVVGYGLNIHAFNPVNDEYMGDQTIFWIRCLDKKIKSKNLLQLANNIETNTQIVNSQGWNSLNFDKNMLNETVKMSGWEYLYEFSGYDYYNSLPGFFRHCFISESKYAPYMSTDKELPVLETTLGFSKSKDDFPYSKELSKEEIVKSGGIMKTIPRIYGLNDPDVISGLANPGDPITDVNGLPVVFDTLVTYNPDEILKIGFVEDWFFDKENLTIQKKVKGIIPMVLQVNPVNDEVEGFRKLYCIRYDD